LPVALDERSDLVSCVGVRMGRDIAFRVHPIDVEGPVSDSHAFAASQ
jgi:hypothetical protein